MGGPKGAPKKPGHEMQSLREAALAYADADEDREYVRASDNLRKAASSYSSRLLAASRGRKGGIERARNLTPEQRSEAARKAITARWAKQQGQKASHT